VTAVAVTSDTHGDVSLAASTVTYTPTVGYTGPADFHYTVCDNSRPALCPIGSVSVTVPPLDSTAQTVTFDDRSGQNRVLNG
jgi:hypothetical protein